MDVPLLRLTAIELDTLKALAAGLTVPEVAAIRYISIDTVKTQRQRLYRKLGVPNGQLAIARGYCWGILDADVPPELAFEQHERYADTVLVRSAAQHREWVAQHKQEAAPPRRSLAGERPRGPANRTGRLEAVQEKLGADDLYARFPALAALEERASAWTVTDLSE